MVEKADNPIFFDQIQWGAEPLLRDQSLWEQNVKLVKTLCDIADNVKWLDGKPGKDGYIHMPEEYSVKDVAVQFLPHWGFVTIGGINYDSTIPGENILKIVEHMTQLKQLGARLPKPVVKKV